MVLRREVTKLVGDRLKWGGGARSLRHAYDMAASGSYRLHHRHSYLANLGIRIYILGI
jgi:hypothetical protein